MADKGRLDTANDALNLKIENLSESVENMRKTLGDESVNIIKVIEKQSRQASRLQIIYLTLTSILAISAGISTYFSYRTVLIYSDMKSMQSTQTTIEKMRAVKDVVDFLKGFSQGLSEADKVGPRKPDSDTSKRGDASP